MLNSISNYLSGQNKSIDANRRSAFSTQIENELGDASLLAITDFFIEYRFSCPVTSLDYPVSQAYEILAHYIKNSFNEIQKTANNNTKTKNDIYIYEAAYYGASKVIRFLSNVKDGESLSKSIEDLKASTFSNSDSWKSIKYYIQNPRSHNMKTDWFLPLEFNNSRDFRIKCQIITYITTQQLLSFCLMGMFNNKHQTLHPQLKVNFVFALEMEFCLLTQILLQYNAIIGITEKFRLERFVQQEQWLPVFTAYYKTINQTHYTPSLTEMCAHAVHSEMKQNPQFADAVKHCIPDELYKMASNEPTFQRFYEDTEMAKTIGKKLDLKRPGIRQPR